VPHLVSWAAGLYSSTPFIGKPLWADDWAWGAELACPKKPRKEISENAGFLYQFCACWNFPPIKGRAGKVFFIKKRGQLD